MDDESKKAEEVFDRALQISINDLKGFLLGACGGDEELQQRVEALLAAHDQQSGCSESS